MQKTKVLSDLDMCSNKDEVEATDGNPNWKDGLTLEVFMSFCFIALIAFILIAITYRLYNP